MAKKKTKKVGACEFEIDSADDTVFYLGRSKKETVNILIQFARKECENAWMDIPKRQADMKRRFLTEISLKLIGKKAVN